MQGSITEWTYLTGNITGGLIVMYWLVDSIRNWNGSPELRILKEQMQKMNEQISSLIKKLSLAPSSGR